MYLNKSMANLGSKLPKKNRWLQVCFSDIGKRKRNEDRAEVCSFCLDDSLKFSYLSVCDGVGGSENGDICADAISSGLKNWVKYYIENYGKSSLYMKQEAILHDTLYHLQIPPFKKRGASASSLILFDHKRKKDGYRLFVSWTGDCRAYCLDHTGNFRLLTCDHHDNEGRLSSFYTIPDGKVHGEPGTYLYTLDREPLVLALTTDGMHDKCTNNELKRFFTWCLLEQHLDGEKLGALVKRFIEMNISDNYSAACLFRKKGLPKSDIAKILQNNSQ
jgi:serine/threonine protein phosphatase PrpC